ncbi:MAG TPA: hypothetical protein VGC64_07650, partial [Pyrinomonadaceae bacterium]
MPKRGEFDFIERIRRRARKLKGAHVPGLMAGIGDDAAIIREREGRETLITTDLLVEEIDFRRTYHPPRLLGHKALA